MPGRGSTRARRKVDLVRALRKQRDQHHQIRQGEQPLIGLRTSRFGGARDEAQMAALGEVVDMVDANPRQTCDFRVGEDFLARLYGNHGLAPGPRFTASCISTGLTPSFDASCNLNAANILSNSRSVPSSAELQG